MRTSNRVRKGDVAGSLDKYGYLRIYIDGRHYFCHRLAWLYMYGSWPKSELDHINGVRTDNSIGNLRESNRFEQNQKLSTRSDNNSGIKGVSKRERDGKWKAAITIDGTYKFLGDFDTKSDAALALAIYKKEVLNA